MMRIQRADALVWMGTAPAASFELVLLDPPFGAGLHSPALLAATRLLVPGGMVYVEAAEPPPTESPASLSLHRHTRAGMVHASLWRRCED